MNSQQPAPSSLAEQAVHALLGADEKFAEFLGDELFGFGIAVIAMERGHHVARLDWKIPGKYVYLQCAGELFSVELAETEHPDEQPNPAVLKSFLAWRNGSGQLVPWTPSQDAVLAKDWFIGKSGEFNGGGKRPPSAEPIQN